MSSNRPLRIGTAHRPRMKLIPLLVTGSVATWAGDGRAQQAASAQATTSQLAQVEFDDAFLANRVGKNFDIARFEQRNITAPGVYSVDVRVGVDWIGRHDVRFAAVPDAADAQPCFDRALLERIGVDFSRLAPDAVARLHSSDACHLIGDIVPNASATFDFTRQTLTLGIPQASLVRRARGGAIVAHRGGITFSQPVSETFAIVEAPGAAGARITNASGARVDGNGYAIVPYLTPYSLNTVALDPKGISLDVELKETSRQVAPRAGAVPLIRFATDNGRAALIHARMADGTPLPFGSSVYDETGKDVGVVGQASRIFARGLKHNGELTVRWSKDGGSACRIGYAVPTVKRQSPSAGIQQIESVCVPASTITGNH